MRHVLMLALGAALAPGQEPGPGPAPGPGTTAGLQAVHVEVPGCPQHCFVLALRCPPAEARCRGRWAQGRLPASAAHGVEWLGDGLVLLHATVSSSAVEAGLGWCAAVLGEAVAAAPDLVELALAEAALAADDEASVFPGPMLQRRARAALFAGTWQAAAPTGDPDELLALCPKDLDLGPVQGAVLVSVGGGEVARLQAGTAALAALCPKAAPASAPARAAPGPYPPWRSGCQRARGSFVACAFPAADPLGPDAQAFALGVEVLRSRATVTFREFRGREDWARAPFVMGSWITGEPLVLVCRRGPDGAPPERPRGEIEELLAQLRTRPPSAAEVAAAARQLQAEAALPPYQPGLVESLVRLPEGLYTRARVLALWTARGWDRRQVDGLPAVGPEAVARALLPALVPEGLWWGELVPTAPPPGQSR